MRCRASACRGSPSSWSYSSTAERPSPVHQVSKLRCFCGSAQESYRWHIRHEASACRRRSEVTGRHRPSRSPQAKVRPTSAEVGSTPVSRSGRLQTGFCQRRRPLRRPVLDRRTGRRALCEIKWCGENSPATGEHEMACVDVGGITPFSHNPTLFRRPVDDPHAR